MFHAWRPARDIVRVAVGHVFLRHPRMRYGAGFTDERFSDTPLTLTYLAADNDRFDAARTWARAGRPVRRASNPAAPSGLDAKARD